MGNQVQDTSAGNSLCQEVLEFGLLDVVKGSFDIPLNDPIVFVPLVDVAVQQRDTIHRSATRAKAVRAVEEVALPDRFQQHLEQVLNNAVFDSEDPQWSQLAVR